MSYRTQTKDGVVIYHHAPLKATAAPRSEMPDIHFIFVEGENKTTPTEEGPVQGYKCTQSGHCYTFFYRPSRKQLIVEFQNHERYAFESVSQRLYDKLVHEDQRKGGSPGHLLHARIVSRPDKHPFRKLTQ